MALVVQAHSKGRVSMENMYDFIKILFMIVLLIIFSFFYQIVNVINIEHIEDFIKNLTKKERLKISICVLVASCVPIIWLIIMIGSII